MAQQQTFEAFIAQERERLGKNRETFEARLRDAQAELEKIDNELRAIDAYERVKKGEPEPQAKKERAPRAPSQGRRGGKREALIELLKDNPDGLTRGEILEKMGLKDDKAGAMSVSNALTNMVKANQVGRNDKKYVAA